MYHTIFILYIDLQYARPGMLPQQIDGAKSQSPVHKTDTTNNDVVGNLIL